MATKYLYLFIKYTKAVSNNIYSFSRSDIDWLFLMSYRYENAHESE